MTYGAHDTAQHCRHCLRRKDDETLPATCWGHPGQQHEWEVKLSPHHKVRGWRLMLLFTWDLLFTKREE